LRIHKSEPTKFECPLLRKVEPSEKINKDKKNPFKDPRDNLGNNLDILA